MTAAATLLLLADSRLPAGGHAHSGGVEAAVGAGAVHDDDSLAAFLRGRLATSGLVAAALAAAACRTAGATEALVMLDREADARTASPAQREASRAQGRLLLRVARRVWPSPALDDLARAVTGPHHAVVLGAVAAVAGCGARDAALAAAYHSVTGPATAAVRLLGLDPVAVHRILAGLAPALENTADTADTADTAASPAALPAHAAPALDLLAERHVRTQTRLFVS